MHSLSAYLNCLSAADEWQTAQWKRAHSALRAVRPTRALRHGPWWPQPPPPRTFLRRVPFALPFTLRTAVSCANVANRAQLFGQSFVILYTEQSEKTLGTDGCQLHHRRNDMCIRSMPNTTCTRRRYMSFVCFQTFQRSPPATKTHRSYYGTNRNIMEE